MGIIIDIFCSVPKSKDCWQCRWKCSQGDPHFSRNRGHYFKKNFTYLYFRLLTNWWYDCTSCFVYIFKIFACWWNLTTKPSYCFHCPGACIVTYDWLGARAPALWICIAMNNILRTLVHLAVRRHVYLNPIPPHPFFSSQLWSTFCLALMSLFICMRMFIGSCFVSSPFYSVTVSAKTLKALQA